MKFYAFCSFLVFFFLTYAKSNIIDPVQDFKPSVHRRCNHQKKEHKKNYLAGKYDRKLASTYYNDIQFQNMRIHFDYTYTLPYEEKMIRELVMPPVKRFFENTLSVRRFPGKLRFPKSVGDCQGIPVPKHLQKEGVDTDLIIIVSTYKGMKKYFYEKYYGNLTQWGEFNGRKAQSTNKEDNKHSNRKIVEYLEKYFSSKKKKSEKATQSNGLQDIFKNNKNNTHSNNSTPPWEVNDSPGDVVGWSFTCLQDTYTLRPVAGVMQYVADISPTPRAIEEAIWTTLHELMHVLVMDFDLYADFIDSDFNKLGYEKTIKLKTNLKDLDKLLEERKSVLNDLISFANFNSTLFNQDAHQSINNSTENSNTTSNKTDNNTNNNSSSYSAGKVEAESNNNASKQPNTTNSNNKLKGNSKLRKVRNEVKEKSAAEMRFKQEEIKEKTSNKSDHNSSTVITNSTIDISAESNVSLSALTLTEDSYVINNIQPPLYKTIKMKTLDTFYEVPIPKGLNLTVLVSYIENFLENTKLYIKTPKVVEFSKKHFGCDTVDGVELEHFGGLGSSFSHWSKRILNTEFMIADSYGENYISNFTLALLEDSGWYKVDYSKSEVIPWGRNKGCEFLEEKCIMKKKKKNSFFTLNLGMANSMNEKDKALSTHSHVYDSNFKEEFCTSFDEEKCSISHTFRAICGVSTYEASIPKEYQYFDNPNVGGFVSFGDYCPYPIEWMDRNSITPMGSCRNGIQFRQDLGEKVCENCRCFHSSLVEEKLFTKNSAQMKSDPKKAKFHHLEDTRAACYEAKCRIDKNRQIELIIIIDDVEIKCPKGGAVLSVDGYKGFIECPKVSTVCTGTLDPKGDYTSTSAYNLFSHLSEQLLSILYDFIKTMFNK